MAEATGGLSIGSILFNISRDLFGHTVEAVGIYLKTELGVRATYLRAITAEALDSITDAEADDNTGSTPGGLLRVFEAFMLAVAKASIFLTPEIAEELYTEMVQEGFSNAIQTSIGGSLQTILNVFRGGFPINPDEIDDSFLGFDDLDSNTLALISAGAGANLPVTYFRIKRGYDRFIEDKYSAVRGQLSSILDDMNDINMWRIRRLLSYASRRFDDCVDIYYDIANRYLAICNHVIERALTRVQEIANQVETVYRWWQYSVAHPDKAIISEDEALRLFDEAEIELEAIDDRVSWILTVLTGKFEDAVETYKLDSAILAYESVLDVVFEKLKAMAEAGWVDRSGDVDKLESVFKKVTGYRHATGRVVGGRWETEFRHPLGRTYKDMKKPK